MKRLSVTCFAGLAVALAQAACVSVGLGPGSAQGGAGDSLAKKRRLVHIDHVDPAKVTQFEEARRELLAAYAANGLREGTTTLLETKDDQDRPEFLSLRPFAAYADIDKLNDAAAARGAAIGKELDRLDALTHATLVPPHANAIWLVRPDLSYSPAGAPGEADATAARILIEEVAPAASDEYEAAVKAVTAGLGRARSPLARIAFTSSYGTGEYVALWLGRSAADCAGLDGEPADVAAALEKERAQTVRSTTRTAFIRRELSSR